MTMIPTWKKISLGYKQYKVLEKTITSRELEGQKKKQAPEYFVHKKKIYAMYETKYLIYTRVLHRAFCVVENHDDDDVGTASTHADGELALPSTVLSA
jgi:hypothetical protein